MVPRTRWSLFLWVLGVAGLSTSCAVTPPHDINERYREILTRRRDQYELKDGDNVTVRIYNSAGDLQQQALLVLPDGRSDPFFMPNHRFSGKTVPQVMAEVKRHVKAEVEDPEVSISVAPRGEVVYVNGQVERFGLNTVDLTTDMTLREALAVAGGVKITADSDYVLLHRPHGAKPGQPERFRIDINDLSEEIFLLPGDHIYVQRNFFATVVAYLREYVFGIIPSQLWAGGLVGGVI